MIIRHHYSAPATRDCGLPGFFFLERPVPANHPWEGIGPSFQLASWGERRWSLDLTKSQPGLIDESGQIGPLLAVESVSTPGRCDQNAFRPEALMGFETRANRVVATYRPIAWSELEVRVTWTALSQIAMGLEVQISTRSVGELKRLEIGVLTSRLEELGPITYEPHPIAWSIGKQGHQDDLIFVPMFFRDDVTHELSADAGMCRRYFCFGHDLERGVVLRARFRGLWLDSEGIADRARAEANEFATEELPLGT